MIDQSWTNFSYTVKRIRKICKIQGSMEDEI